MELTPATQAAIVEHGENCRDAVDVPLFGPPHPDDVPGAITMRVIPAQPHPHVFQRLAWNLDPPVNTDSQYRGRHQQLERDLVEVYHKLGAPSRLTPSCLPAMVGGNSRYTSFTSSNTEVTLRFSLPRCSSACCVIRSVKSYEEQATRMLGRKSKRTFTVRPRNKPIASLKR